MNPKILGLRTTIYKVNNLSEAKKWYSTAFGIAPYFDEPFYVGFTIGGYELGLLPENSIKGNNILTYWGVENINEAYSFFLSIGATSVEAPRNVGEGIIVCAVKDPWENVIGLIYNPRFIVK
jgi:lactoylglutathione lyase